MSVSLVVLTYNRLDIVRQCVPQMLESAGYPIDEFIWVDNGSDGDLRDFMLSLDPDIAIMLSTNTGVAHGYNTGYKAASGDIIARPGCDMLMPDSWLADLVNVMASLPDSGILSLWGDGYIDAWAKDEPFRIGRRTVVKATAIGSCVFKRSILDDVGYLPEHYGLYGWDDMEWEKAVSRSGYTNYALTDARAKHLSDLETDEYKEFKRKEVDRYSTIAARRLNG